MVGIRPHTPGVNNLVNRDLLNGRVTLNNADLASNKDDPSPTVEIAIEEASLVQRAREFKRKTGAWTEESYEFYQKWNSEFTLKTLEIYKLKWPMLGRIREIFSEEEKVKTIKLEFHLPSGKPG